MHILLVIDVADDFVKAANTLQLFTFVRADLSSFKPKPKPTGPAYEIDTGGFTDIPAPSEPDFPKSLYLIAPLTTVYDLNPVAPEAQASVPVPDGLNLDMWFIPPPKEAEAAAVSNGVVKKKKGKGKEKAENGTSTVKVKKKKEKVEFAMQDVVQETSEEKAERERVYFISSSFSWSSLLTDYSF